MDLGKSRSATYLCKVTMARQGAMSRISSSYEAKSRLLEKGSDVYDMSRHLPVFVYCDLDLVDMSNVMSRHLPTIT